MDMGGSVNTIHELLEGCSRGDVAVGFVSEYWLARK